MNTLQSAVIAFSISLVMFLGGGAGGVWLGYRFANGEAATKLIEKNQALVAQINENADAEKQRIAESAKRELSARLAMRDIKTKGELDAIRKSRAECARDTESHRLLVDSVRTANGEAASASIMYPAVRSSSDAGGYFGAIGKALGVSGGGGIRSLPTLAY